MAAHIQPGDASNASGSGETATVAVHFTPPRRAVDEARLDEACPGETAREAPALDRLRRGLLTRPGPGRVLGLDRFETAALLKRRPISDDPTHEEVDAGVESTTAPLDRARR